MDPNKAVQILLAAASALTIAVPVAAETTLKKPVAAETTVKKPPTPVATSAARQAVHTLSALYGIIAPEYGDGKLAETNAMAMQLRSALAAISTEEGKRVAKEEGLSAERVAEISKSLDDWEARVASWATKAGQNLRPLYGIFAREQIKASDLAKMKALSNQIHDAFVIIETPSGQVAARNAKLEPAKLSEIKVALGELDAAIAKLTTRPAK
jgi:hypothetical protein